MRAAGRSPELVLIARTSRGFEPDRDDRTIVFQGANQTRRQRRATSLSYRVIASLTGHAWRACGLVESKSSLVPVLCTGRLRQITCGALLVAPVSPFSLVDHPKRLDVGRNPIFRHERKRIIRRR